jgi:hypothetical protein
MPDDIRERLQRTQRVVGRYWNQLLQDARDAGVIRSDLDLSATRMLILGALNWTAEWYQPRGLSPAEIAHHATAIVLDGLAVNARPRARAGGKPAGGKRATGKRATGKRAGAS